MQGPLSGSCSRLPGEKGGRPPKQVPFPVSETALGLSSRVNLPTPTPDQVRDLSRNVLPTVCRQASRRVMAGEGLAALRCAQHPEYQHQVLPLIMHAELRTRCMTPFVTTPQSWGTHTARPAVSTGLTATAAGREQLAQKTQSRPTRGLFQRLERHKIASSHMAEHAR